MVVSFLHDSKQIHIFTVRPFSCPSLFVSYGTADSLVDKSGVDELYAAWKDGRKKYLLIEQGPHGKLTVLKAQGAIRDWIEEQ